MPRIILSSQCTRNNFFSQGGPIYIYTFHEAPLPAHSSVYIPLLTHNARGRSRGRAGSIVCLYYPYSYPGDLGLGGYHGNGKRGCQGGGGGGVCLSREAVFVIMSVRM